MIKFFTGYTSGVEWFDLVAEGSIALIVVFFAALLLWRYVVDPLRFARNDRLDIARIMGAYTGETSPEPTTHRSTDGTRSPFATRRNKLSSS